MSIKICTVVVLLSSIALAGCKHDGLWGYDEFDRYTQRLDTVTDSAGDAKERNRVVQTDQPWPRYSYDHSIPVDGQRMTRAVEIYRSGPTPAGVQAPTGASAQSPTQSQPPAPLAGR
jgi:hypothetical protein